MLRAGKKVLLVEGGDQVGGLLRPVTYKDYSVDLGQKQFYNRIPEAHRFLQDFLGEGYQTFDYHTGIFYKGRVLEREKKWRGKFRGMSFPMLLRGGLSLMFSRMKFALRRPRTVADDAHRRNGKFFTRIFSQGFDEKLKQIRWEDVLLERISQDRVGAPYAALDAGASAGDSGQTQWWHPVKGSFGLINRLENEIKEMGGRILLSSKASRIEIENSICKSVTIENKIYQVDHIVSSIRINLLAKLTETEFTLKDSEVSFRRGVILVYFFLDHEPKFPHTCLHVTCPQRRVGRITNYAAYNVGMVPANKCCLSFEVFCNSDDPLFSKSDDELASMIHDEFADQGLYDKDQLENFLVLKFSHGDPATNWTDYKDDPGRMELYQKISAIENLYNVSRTGIDKTIHAALLAARCIKTNQKDAFLRQTRPDVKNPTYA